MEHYRKLVRDKIPSHLESKGIPHEMHQADKEEYRSELIKKLNEEILEFSEAGEIEELADILEVIDALKTLPEYEGVLAVQQKKREEKGGFTERFIVEGDK